MKKEVYKRIISVIMEYMPDNQILAILGEGDRYAIENGVIIDKQMEVSAEVRDVRSLNYNISAEPAPGNMSQRMLELQALLEMNQTIPVPPEQIINKMDISETEKKLWIDFINSQQEAQAQAQQEAAQQEKKHYRAGVAHPAPARARGPAQVAGGAGRESYYRGRHGLQGPESVY